MSEEEPVDRRGLFRDLFRQAGEAIAPALGARLEPLLGAGPAETRTAHPAASVEQLLGAAADLGLGARAESIEQLARRSLRLVPAAHAREAAVGFGGPALMNEGQEWPSWRGRPLTLLAQVEAGGELGRLLFFYDVLGRPSGCLAAHRGSAQVLRAADGRLLPVDGPALPAAQVPGQIDAELVIPPAGSVAERLGLSRGEREAWEALREELAGLQGTAPAHVAGEVFRVVHRVLGYADSASDELGLACELASAGEDVIEGRAHLHPGAAAAGEPAGRWELLAQFSGDGKLGWPWVAQRVYFMIDRDALAAGELEPVWAIAR